MAGRKFPEALAEFKKALEIDPKSVEARWRLAGLLRRKGDFTEALQVVNELDRELPENAVNRDALKPVAAEIGKLRDFDAGLTDYTSGKKRPANATDGFLLWELCLIRERYASAAHFYAAACESDPERGAQILHTYFLRVVSCPVAAACGTEGTIDDRMVFSRQARQLFRAHMALLEKAAREEAAAADRESAADTVLMWKETPFLEVVRDPDSLAKLSDAEQKEWKQLWADLDTLLKKIDPAESKK